MTSLPKKILQNESEFNKVVALRGKKKKGFLCMNDSQLEKVIEEVILFIIATRPIKCLGLNLTGFCYMKTASGHFLQKKAQMDRKV